MLHLEKVNGNNVWDILKLTVSESQKNFVAANEISIIEAYTAITGNGHAFPFGIYDEDKPVGFLMIGFDVDDYWTDAPEIAKGNYNLWRLMIDKAYQNRGYGKEAVSLALEFIKSMLLISNCSLNNRAVFYDNFSNCFLNMPTVSLTDFYTTKTFFQLFP